MRCSESGEVILPAQDFVEVRPGVFAHKVCDDYVDRRGVLD
jgi:hypothetical protein